ncbi:hypothetical protein FA592_14085 (plasmid) [Sulfurospirillum diekertiae]|uniref:5-methylcytosine restriction system specificity protein McrC n=1 Tax=Sulfurospirillum diekertiae TaxID=1854492 RepID=UPI001430A6D4|nr:hypothetical protein FA592_14085 [Sulfurospirillum diekertiae]
MSSRWTMNLIAFFSMPLRCLKNLVYPNLHKCEMILDEVSFLHFSNLNQINIEFNRMNSRYLKSFETAIMILKKLIPLPNDENNKSFAFLFDMSEVFEKFIGRLYQSIDSTTKLQSQRNFGNLQLKPDILTSSMIIDTKYKIVQTKDNLSVADKYQMFTYGTNFNIDNTMLLYPEHLHKTHENLILGVGEKAVKLKLRSIDLNQNNEDYEQYIETIKYQVRIVYGTDCK